MADALNERCWVCTKLCDAERGCIVAPEAYAGHDVLACSDNHFNRAYEMAMGIKPANRTFYDFARVAERRDDGRGKDYGFRIQEIVFEPNFPPIRREELSKSLRAENLSDKDYRQLLKEIMQSTQSKGEFEWAVSEIRKLNQKGAETFEADCRDCYGTGGLYDSRLGIDDECASCGGTGEHSIKGYKDCCTKENIRVHHRGGAIYHDDEDELTYYPAECMVCGREYEAGLPMYSSSKELLKLEAEALVIPDGDSVPHHILNRLDREGIKYRFIEGDYGAETFEAESVSDLELKKDSCCCGATKKTPCVCMILGSDCSAKKPMCACYRLKAIQQKDEKGAETFEARFNENFKPKKTQREKKYKIKTMIEMHPDMLITSSYHPDNPFVGHITKKCSSSNCDELIMTHDSMIGKKCLKCYDLMMNERGYYDSTGNGKYVEGEKRPQWMPKLMKDSVEEEGEGTYSRHDKGYVAGLFLKSVKDAKLNGILKQTKYQDSDLIGSDSRKELKVSLNRYEPIALTSLGEMIIFNDTAYNVKIFKSMIGGLPPNTKIRISGKPKYPLMFEFDYLTEPYIMFLAPMVFDDSRLNEKIKQHQDFGKSFLRREKPKISDPNKIPDWIIQQGKDAKESHLKRKKMEGLREETKKIKDSISDEDKEEWFKYTNLKSRDENNFTMEEIISYYEGLLSKYSGNDPDFDPEKADRNRDGEISDWERAVGNAVAKGIREHKERKEAESRPVSYMVKSDAHKLTEASKRIHDKADENREYPEWWKSKLSVARNNADQLSDFLDYAVVEGVFESEGDHDHEEIDELIDKLNTVVDFAITFVHDGGYGGEPKGILVDEDLGIKTEVVHYIEGSIQLNLVRDINTNELLSVRFSLTGDPEQTPIVYLPLPEEITTVPEDDRVSAKN